MCKVIDIIFEKGWQKELLGFNKELVLRQAYMIAFGIGTPEINLLDHVSDSDVDGFRELNWHNKIIDEFSMYELHNLYGISIKEFLEQPLSICNEMLKKGRSRFEMKLKALDASETERKLREREIREANARNNTSLTSFERINP